jgi:hypothetical protein
MMLVPRRSLQQGHLLAVKEEALHMVIAVAQCDQRGRREAYEVAKAAEYLKHGGKEGYCRAKLKKQREREALELAAVELEAVAEAEAAAAARAVAEARAVAKAMAIKANEQRLFLLPV